MGHYVKTQLQQKMGDELVEYEKQLTVDPKVVEAYQLLADGELYDVLMQVEAMNVDAGTKEAMLKLRCTRLKTEGTTSAKFTCWYTCKT